MALACVKYMEVRIIFWITTVITFLVFALTTIENPYHTKRNPGLIPEIKNSGSDLIWKHILAGKKLVTLKLKPEGQLQSLCKNVDTVMTSKMTSLKYSKLEIIKNDNAGNIHVAIETYDLNNKPKTNGDDVIVVWASESTGKGYVSGSVIDHKNGSYTGILKVYWSGLTKVYAKLASTVENTCLRIKAMNKYGNAVFAMQRPWGIRGIFRTNLMQELTACGANPKIVGFKALCNFTALNGNMEWFCGKPKHKKLGCSDISSFATGNFDNRMVPEKEKIQKKGHGVFKEVMSLEIQQSNEKLSTESNISCKLRPSLLSWTESEPTGYWFKDKWNFIHCYSKIQHNDSFYAQCLKNKNLFIIGDSTVRQYSEYFVEHVLNLGHVDLKDGLGTDRKYHNYKVFTNYGVNLTYLKHEMPFHNPDFPVNNISSVSQIIESIAQKDFEDNSLILIVNYNSHFSAYPPASFRTRIKHLTVALESLLQKKPKAKIFLKGPHLFIDDSRWFDPRISLLFKEILKEEFAKLMNKVTYLDTWSITVAHNSQILHPRDKAFISQINQFMAYIC